MPYEGGWYTLTRRREKPILIPKTKNAITNQRGFIVPVILIIVGIVLAVSIGALLFVYKEKPADTNTKMNTNTVVACAKIIDRTTCAARSDCLMVDSCIYITASNWAERCQKANPQEGACSTGGFQFCAPVDCSKFDWGTGQGARETDATTSDSNTTSDPTADWKTYTNSEHNYSFQLPASFVKDRDLSSYTASNTTIYVLVHQGNPRTVPFYSEIHGQLTPKEVTVGDRVGYQTESNEAGCRFTWVEVALQQEKKLQATFQSCIEVGASGQEFIDQVSINQILSTFQFTK